MDKKNFLEQLSACFPEFELTVGDAKHVDGESIFVNGHSIELAWSPPLDKLENKDPQCLEMLMRDIKPYIQETCHILSKD